jgi:hypothetical protein
MPRIANTIFAGVACLAIALTFVAVMRSGVRDDSYTELETTEQPVQVNSESSGTRQEFGSTADSTKVLTTSATKQHPVIIRKPNGPPRIELAGTDPQGRTGSVACSTCHAVREPNIQNISAGTLDEFHQGMTFNHGTIACYACHNPNDSDALRLADGSKVAYENVMTLCSQCHSKQAESFAHGAHGGMNGHWDLTRGPQMKNNCIDCHDPHAPAYPKMIVGFKPKDRFNEPHDEHAEDGH